jgi:hypothetical protein
LLVCKVKAITDNNYSVHFPKITPVLLRAYAPFYLRSMDKELLAWLNTSRPYQQGVEIYHRLGSDVALKDRLLRGTPSHMAEELFQALRCVYYSLKGITPQAAPAPKPEPEAAPTAPVPRNPELEAACKQEADKAYKVLANVRALLFNQCTVEAEPRENLSAKVDARGELAMAILDLHPKVDELYNRYRYVQAHGRLPDEPTATPEEAIPQNPVLQERMRLNIIKCINKLKLKPQTPERVAYIQTLSAKLQTVTDAVDRFIRDYSPNPAG